MTRIGFAYNQKPELSLASSAALSVASDDEPPSTRRVIVSQASSTNPFTGRLTSVAAPPPPESDLFAEWDSAETIDAVADALAAFGDVIRLEATPEFPDRLRDAQPDIVFNIAEGLTGPNREAHVPAICEFYGLPYS